MKLLKLTVSLLFLTIISASCDWFIHEHPPLLGDSLLLSFQDTLGNDLISGIEFDYGNGEGQSWGEIHNLDVLYINNGYTVLYSVSVSKLDYYYIRLSAGLREMKTKIIFTLRSPYIFENNNYHEIITYWIPESSKSKKYVCSHVEYGGKEFPVAEVSKNFTAATIILDR